MNRRVLAVGAVALLGTTPLWWGQSAASVQANAQLVLQAQTFAVSPGGSARFDFVVTGDVPEIAPTTTTTTSTTTSTTSTTTTTTSTTTIPADGSVPPTVTQPGDAAPTSEPTTATTSTSTSTTTTTTLPPGPRMTVQVRSHRAVATRDGVANAVDGNPGPVLDILEFDLDDVAMFDEATGERRLGLDVPIAAGVADVNELDLLEPGVHPISVQIRRDGSLVASTTTLVDVVRTDGPGRGPFAFVTVAAVDDTGPLPDDTDLERASSSITELVELISSSTDTVNVALPPVYLATVLEQNDQIATDLDAALTADDRLFVLPDQPLEPSAAIDAGLGDELARGVANGERQLDDRFTATPTARAAWIVDDALTVDGATAIRNLGIPLLLLPYEHYLELGGNLGAFTDPTLLFDATLSDDSSIRAMVVDPITRLLEPDTAGSPIERAIHLMGDASALRYQFDPALRSMILTTPDIGIPDPDVLRELSIFVGQHPNFTFEQIRYVSDNTNSMFIDGEPVTLELDPRASRDLDERVRLAQTSRLRAADAGSMLPATDGRTAAWTEDLSTALSTGLTDSESAAMVGAVDSEVAKVRAQVVQPEPFSFTIAGDAAPIPLRVENRGDTPLRVVVHAESDKLTFPEGDSTVVLEPNQINNVDIPVEARSNGVFPVVVEIRTPAGGELTDPLELTARVSALTGLGRLFTVGAVLVLATWWFTYFRRRRIEHRAADIAQSQVRHPATVANQGTDAGEAVPGDVADTGQ